MSAPASPAPPNPPMPDSVSPAAKSTADGVSACPAPGSQSNPGSPDATDLSLAIDPVGQAATASADEKPVSSAMKPNDSDVDKNDPADEERAKPEEEAELPMPDPILKEKEEKDEATKPVSEGEEELAAEEEEEKEEEDEEEEEEEPRQSNLAANTALKSELEPDLKGESIEHDPNLAVVISFLTKFGAQCGLEGFNLEELETHLESREEVLPKWMQLHIKLLRKINKSVTPAKWERSLVKFVYLVSTDDGWDLEKFGYRLVPSTMKLRILKSLLESQFDFNVKFKSEVNKQDAQDLRCDPLGWDKLGNAYWYNMDDEANLRVYKEDPDEETWELAARSKDEFLELIDQLKAGATYLKPETTTVKSEEPALEEDDDDPQELANIIRDTGPVPESCQTSYGNSDDDDDSRPLQIDEGPAKESDPEELKGESGTAQSTQAAPKTIGTPNSGSIPPPSVDPTPSSVAATPSSAAPAPSAAPVPPSSVTHTPTPAPPTPSTPAPVPAPSPPKKSHYSIESLISKDDRHMKRPLEVENGSTNAEKRPKLASSEAISEPTMVVVGQGNGVDNKDAPEPSPVGDKHDEEDEAIEEPVMVFTGFGNGVDNLARNPDNDNDSNSNGVDHEEKKLGESELKSVKRGHSESTKETMTKEDQIKSDPEAMQEDDEPKPKRGKEDEEPKSSNGKDESACDTKEDKKTPKKKKHLSKKGQDPEDEDEPVLRSSRRTSSRIATLRIREAERRQKEEENALDDFREKMRRKAEREQNRLDKYRAMGREFEREMAKTRKRGKAETSDEDYEDEGEGGSKTATKRKRRKKKKKKRGEENLREFAKFSSGSSDDEGLEGEEDEDLDGEHEEEDQDEEVLFHSDHEFSCESDVPDGEAQPIQHARTATKGKKRRKKARKAESVEAIVAADSDSEEDDSDDNWACKKCNKRDHPEWILLCDKCDDGWHASCLRPSLMVIPEGSWFCPNCQHAVLLTKLEENLVSFEVLLKKKDAETKRKERLAFVSMSLSNILPPKATSSGAKKPANKTKSENQRRHVPRKRHRSDDSFSGSSSGSSSDANSSSSSEEEEPVRDGRRRATRNVSYSLKAYDDMIRSAIADEVVYLPVAGKGKALETAAPDDDEDEGGEEEEEEEEDVEQPKSSTGQSGLGRGKDMSNILGADDDEDEGASAKEKDDDDNDKDEIPPSNVPQPMKMEIQKEIPSAKGKKKAKKNKKFGALSSSDDGDGDSGSDFVASEISLEDDEEDEEEFLDDVVSSDDGGLGTSSRKKSSRAATRKSNRNRKVMYDEDFVFDGSDSEDDPSKKKRKRRKNDDSWDSEISLEDDEEEYGSKKKKKSSGKKKSRLKYDSLSSEEDDEDFEASISKKKQRILSDTSAQRKTRGKKIQFEWEESDDDSDVPLRKSKATASSASSRKKKAGKKRVDDTDTEMEDYQSEPELDDDEEEDSD